MKSSHYITVWKYIKFSFIFLTLIFTTFSPLSHGFSLHLSKDNCYFNSEMESLSFPDTLWSQNQPQMYFGQYSILLENEVNIFCAHYFVVWCHSKTSVLFHVTSYLSLFISASFTCTY